MNQLALILLSSWAAGFASFAGGVFARLEGAPETEGKQELIHGVVAFGGGILVAAVAFALTPQGLEVLSPGMLAAVFCLGGLAFCGVDILLSARGGPKSQFMAMLMDFAPEALSLGAVFGKDPSLGYLLAAFIGAQNLPEGFNAYREIVSSGLDSKRTLALLLSVSLLGPLAAGAGYLFLQDMTRLTAGIMCFAAGGILYLVFQDIAPQSRMRRHWTPPLGAVLGFAVGLVGKGLLG